MRIYIDIDDTLAQFREHAVDFGVPRWEGSWYTTDRAAWTPRQCAIQDATNELMRKREFWSTMPVWPGAHELIAAASFHGAVSLLTALPTSLKDEPEMLDMVRRAKIQYAWQRLHVPPERVLVVNRADKVRYAFNPFTSRSNLLIDDAAQNVKEWTEAGGIAHHFDAQGEDGMANAIDFVKCL